MLAHTTKTFVTENVWENRTMETSITSGAEKISISVRDREEFTGRYATFTPAEALEFAKELKARAEEIAEGFPTETLAARIRKGPMVCSPIDRAKHLMQEGIWLGGEQVLPHEAYKGVALARIIRSKPWGTADELAAILVNEGYRPGKQES